MLACVDDTPLDAGPKGAVTDRFCAVSREVRPADQLIRFVVGPDGQVMPDLKRKLPGRGLWLTAKRATIAEALRRNIFTRGFKRNVQAPADLPDITERLLERAALDALAIAGKAGQAIAGFAKVETAIARGKVVGVIHARDAALDGIRKLDGALQQDIAPAGAPIPVIAEFSSSQLDLALGRSNVIHAALLAGAASEGFLARWLRLTQFRDGAGQGNRTKARRQGAQGPRPE